MSYLLNSEYAPPAMLTGMIRAALFDLSINQYTLSRWLPNVSLNDTTFRFTKGGQGLAEAAVFRSYDAESRIGRRETVSQVMGELPPISEKMVLNEWDQLRMRSLADGALLPFIARDAERLARNIGARFEVARGDAIFNGSITINENGVQQTVSFGRSGSHSVVASVLWTDYANATPLDDLESWIQTYIDTNGFPPASILMPRAQFANFRRCDQVRNQVFPLASSAPTVSADQARTVIDSLDFPSVEIYDAQVRTGDSGTVTRITPVDKIALMPPAGSGSPTATDLGATFLGTTVEAMDADYGLAPGDQPGIVAANYKSTDPRRLWTHAVAIGLPVLTNPDLTFVAEVA
jgi:hypothetical protein